MSENEKTVPWNESGELEKLPAVKTQWNKLISLHDAHHYALRHNATMAATFMQVLRIIIPDYQTRSQALIEINSEVLRQIFSLPPVQRGFKAKQNIPPFVKGSMVGVLAGDQGDEANLMAGRVNDYGSYRFEKELDTCPWDIVGSEFCRCTTAYFEALSATFGEPHMEFNMVEAKGCGDLHCRVIGENREKYPLPPRENVIETFGPIATADQIKFTPEEEMYTEPQQFRPECDYTYRNGYCAEWNQEQMFAQTVVHPLGSDNVIAVLEIMEPDKEKVDNVTNCMFETAGKMAFSEFSAIKGIRDWLGVPGDVNDGRVLGALIEVVLQSRLINYTMQAFNEEEVIIDLDVKGLEGGDRPPRPLLTTAYLAMWYGMSKTLVGSQWSAWRETEGVAENVLRLKIAKKIDKYC